MLRTLLAAAFLACLLAGCARNPDGSLVSVKPDMHLLAAFQMPTAPLQRLCLHNYDVRRCMDW
ncbi:MAG: hypothetical protein ACP5NI_02505 [Acetobacteraceae bacterium]